MRKAIGLVIGLVMAVLIIDTGWQVAAVWFPPALPVDADDAAIVNDYVMTMPIAGQGLVAATWLVAGLVGAFAALRVAQWRPAGWVVTGFVVLTAIWNLTQISQPWWLAVLSVAAPVIGGWLAEKHYHRARPGDPLIN